MPSSNTETFTHIAPYDIKDSEEYMNDAQKDHFRLILKEWKRELMGRGRYDHQPP